MEYVICLADGHYYWNPSDKKPPPKKQDRWCHSPLAANKFKSVNEADVKAAQEGLEGYEVKEYEPV